VRSAPEVVHLAVEYDDVASARRQHRLMPFDGEVDDRETTKREPDAGGGVVPEPLVVGASMGHGGGHPSEARLPGRGLDVGLEGSRNAAHRSHPPRPRILDASDRSANIGAGTKADNQDVILGP
jgi:hypothetical protein